MEVILKEDHPSLGYIGDRVSVKRGYARNFLLPRGIAAELNSANARSLKHIVDVIDAKKKKKRVEAQEHSKNFMGLTLSFSLKGNEHGKVFGAVTTRDIEKALLEKGLTVDKKQIRLPEPIKLSGIYEVVVKLHADVAVPVKLEVLVDVPKPVVHEEKPSDRRHRRRDVEVETEADAEE